MYFSLKQFLKNNEVLFNSFGQVYVKKRFVFRFVIKFFRYLPTK